MKLSYNSIFFKFYCLIFAKKVGKDEYGNTYYVKKTFLQKITLEKEGWSFTKDMLKQVKFLKVGMHGYIM